MRSVLPSHWPRQPWPAPSGKLDASGSCLKWSEEERNFKATRTREEEAEQEHAARRLTSFCCCSLPRPAVRCGCSSSDGWLIKRRSSMRPVLDRRRPAGQRDSTSAGILPLKDGGASQSRDIKRPVCKWLKNSHAGLDIHKVDTSDNPTAILEAQQTSLKTFPGVDGDSARRVEYSTHQWSR